MVELSAFMPRLSEVTSLNRRNPRLTRARRSALRVRKMRKTRTAGSASANSVSVLSEKAQFSRRKRKSRTELNDERNPDYTRYVLKKFAQPPSQFSDQEREPRESKQNHRCFEPVFKLPQRLAALPVELLTRRLVYSLHRKPPVEISGRS
jgi:hypothetical protein